MRLILVLVLFVRKTGPTYGGTCLRVLRRLRVRVVVFERCLLGARVGLRGCFSFLLPPRLTFRPCYISGRIC